jgi:hypothetical protein
LERPLFHTVFYTTIICFVNMNNTKMIAMLAAAFVAGSFFASPELRVYAANTVFSADITDGEVKTADLANNAITAAKIKDGEVKAAEIAADAVGASEIQGVTKLIFAECKLTSTEASKVYDAGEDPLIPCTINGVDSDDNAIASFKASSSGCFAVESTNTSPDHVHVNLRNNCNSSESMGLTTIGIIVFDK